MGLWSSIKEIFEDWERIDEKDVPEWVNKAYFKWEKKLPTHPYNLIKYFVGDHFIYKVKHGMGRQGEAPIIGWYKKSRGLNYPEGLPKNKKNMKRWQKGKAVIYTPKDFRNPFEP